MEYQGPRTLEALRSQWSSFFAGDLKAVKAKGLMGQIAASPFRSVCWKLFLGLLPDTSLARWPLAVSEARQQFEVLKKRYVHDLHETMLSERDLALNNPLSQEESSPWKRFFEDNQLQRVITQDVERTFPDKDFFRSEIVQSQMTDILFIYCRENDSVSYRQGMHELLALILWVVDADQLRDASATPTDDPDRLICQLLDPNYVQHDAYAIFERLMATMRPWFDSGALNAADSHASSPSSPQPAEQPLFRGNTPVPVVQSSSAPVMRKCHHIQHVLLKQYDPQLYKHLEALGIEPQLYGIRWLRLLFAREFHMLDVLRLWDAIFADDEQLGMVDYMALSMLLFLRENLVAADYTMCLSRLMRFPPVEDVLTIFERAMQIRELPEKMKPVPINGPLARFTPSATSVPVVDQPLSSASSPALPAAVSSSSSSSSSAASALQRRALGRKGRAAAAAAAAAATSRDDAARVRELEDELDRVRTMNTLLSERMDKGISVLGKLLSEATTESPPDMVRVKIALAAIKQVRDILSGELDFDENILHANETALVMAEGGGEVTHEHSPPPFTAEGAAASSASASPSLSAADGPQQVVYEREKADAERVEREAERARAAAEAAERARIDEEERRARAEREAAEEKERRERTAREAEAARAERERRAALLKEQLFADDGLSSSGTGGAGSAALLFASSSLLAPPKAGNLFEDDDDDTMTFGAMSAAQKNASSAAKLDALFS